MSEKKESNKEVSGFLQGVERIGNKLPNPAIIFIFLSILVIVISGIGASQGWSAKYFDARAGEEVVAEVQSLFNKDGIAYIFNNATKNFTGFAPLGTVLIAIMGVGVAEYSGLIDTSLKKILLGVDPKWLTAVVVFTGIISNVADASGYVVVIPLGAIMFAGAGRHPIAGLAAAFAGVSAGFSANLLIGPNDAVLAGITNEAIISAGLDYQMAPTANWYFMIASTFLLTILGTYVTENIVEKNLGEYHGSYQPDDDPVTSLEEKGLRNAGISLLLFSALMLFFMVGDDAVFRALDSDGAMTLNNFLNNGLLLMIMFLFLIPGYVYGRTVGTMKDSSDLIDGMTEGTASMANYLVLVFIAAQFVDYFGYTNLGIILSVHGAEFLESINFVGLPLIVTFILISAFLNLFIGSASSKWGIMAPIFVPMMMNLGLTPALTQAAYRVGDSITNVITPLMTYFPMIVVFAQRYDKDSGLGTLISTMLPYTAVFFVGWTVLITIWYTLNLPLGPGAFIAL